MHPGNVDISDILLALVTGMYGLIIDQGGLSLVVPWPYHRWCGFFRSNMCDRYGVVLGDIPNYGGSKKGQDFLPGKIFDLD